MQRWLRACANSAQTVSQSTCPVLQALFSQGLACFERQAFPIIHEHLDAIALNTLRERFVGKASLLAFKSVCYAGGCAFQNEGAKEARKRCVERDAPAH